jgi:hypothetical protein
MIQLPRRSVTRFFIPLIDVLTLLFCIFLLMPLVQGSAEPAEEPAATPEEEVERLRRLVDQLRREREQTPDKLREELERLRQEKSQVLQERLAVRVLEIDGKDGKLYYNDPTGRAEVRDAADAQALIERDRKAADEAKRELYYLILYPRTRSIYPRRDQRETYDRWFKGAAHGWDVPGEPPGSRGTTP